ncbi:Gamma-glutamyl phosphate reductase GPR, conserved site [Phytophthora cactorum]|nr:Gamma-glutamyl phosphate reductase GPR, conserved site [Phytophthora cactorum]
MTHSHTFGGYAGERPITRHDLKHATRIVVKMGTSVVSTNGEPALGRIASIVEQVCMLKRQGKEVLLVTSGSVGIGRKRLNKQILLSASLRTHVQGNQQMLALEKKKGAMAAAARLASCPFTRRSSRCTTLLAHRCSSRPPTSRRPRTAPNARHDAQSAGAGRRPIVNENDAGLYNKPPSQPGAKVISVFRPENNDFKIGEKSSVGRGGMGAKIEAAQSAISQGVNAVIIASGFKYGVVNSIMKGASLGTLFVANPGCHQLQALSSEERASILFRIADELKNNSKSILNANRKDLQAAQKSSIDEGLIARLKLSEEKLETLADGIRSIAQSEEPIGRMLKRTELASGLVLHQETASIGVLLVIFESRPDSLPQIAALALRSGNGLLLKGGKEALHSNAMLHKIIVKAVEEATNGKVKKDVIGCAADVKKAIELAIDAKTDYPAACNALESLLLDESLVTSGQDKVILVKLEEAGINLHIAPNAAKLGVATAKSRPTDTLSTEYGSTDLTIEVVNGVSAAIAHINQYSSGHTECIVTEDAAAAERFQQMIDSACVFHNASTRFADGYRFGLGAEVGISTGRIHARGPVGVEGLLTTKWKLVSESGHTVSQFSAAKSDHPLKYTHKKMELIQKEANVARPRSSRL